MRHLDLFSGIGGFSLAADWVWGVEHKIVAFVECDEFCQKVLRKHWPGVPIHGDIRTYRFAENSEHIGLPHGEDGKGGATARRLRQSRTGDADGIHREAIDLLTGGFPCQPFSVSGRKRGTQDDRHLWPEMFRVIRASKTRWVLAENVLGLLNIERGVVLETVYSDLEGEGYEVFPPLVLPACAVGAPHRRDRLWIVGRKNVDDSQIGGRGILHTINVGAVTREVNAFANANSDAPDSSEQGPQGRQRIESLRHAGLAGGNGSHEGWGWEENWYEVATRFCRVDDGLPRVLDRTNRLKALGNAIVPQIAVVIMQAIKEADK